MWIVNHTSLQNWTIVNQSQGTNPVQPYSYFALSNFQLRLGRYEKCEPHMITMDNNHDRGLILCVQNFVTRYLLIKYCKTQDYDLLMIRLLFDPPLCFWSRFLFFNCFWKDPPTNDGCSFNAKLFATWPKWSFFTIKILFSSPRWALYARTQEQKALIASFFKLGW